MKNLLSAPRVVRKQHLLFAVLLSLHAAIAVSVVLQPLDVNRAPAAQRWTLWPFFSDSVHRVGPAADFFAVYHAGLMVLAGQSPYEPGASDTDTPYFFPFRYLPSAAFLPGALFAVSLSPRAAYILWVLAIEAILLTFALVLFRFERQDRFPLLWPIVFLAFPIFLELHMGQMTFLSTVLFVLALQAGQHEASGKRQAVTFLWFFLALTIKPVFLYAVPFLLVRDRQLRKPLLAALVPLAVANLAYFVLHPVDFRIFRLVNFVTPPGGLDTGNYSPVYLFHLILSEFMPWDDYMQAPVWMLARLRNPIFAVAYIFLFLRKDIDPKKAAVFLLLLHFLTYVHVWEHHLSAVIAVGLFYLTRTSDRAAPLLHPGILITVIAMALPGPFILLDTVKDPLVSDPGASWPSWMRLVLAASRAIPLMVLTGLMAADLGRRREPSGATLPV